MATKDFLRSDGLQNFIHPVLAPMSEPEIMINYISRPLRAKIARTGYSVFLDNPDDLAGYAIKKATFKDSTGADKSYLFRFAGTKIYAYLIGSGATSWGTAIHTFTNDPGGICAVPYVNALFVASTNGSNPLYYIKLNSSNVLTVTEEAAAEAPTNPTTLAVYANALFTNDKDASYRMRRSAIGYGTSPDLGSPVVPFDTHQWEQNDNDPATARFYDIDPYSNGLISALRTINNRMVAFMAAPTGDMGMYRYDFTSLVQIPTNVSIRPNGQDTIKISSDGSAHFANNYGIYQFNGDRPKRVSLALGAEGEDIAPGAAVEFEDLYMLSLNSSVTIERDGFEQTLANPVIVRDMIADELLWWDTADRMTGYEVAATSSTDQPLLYSIDEDGNTYIWDSSNDDAGTTISTVLGFRPFYGESLTRPLGATSIFAMSHNPGGQRIRLKRDEDDVYGEATTLNRKIQEIKLEGMMNTRSISVLVTGNSTGARPDFYGYAFEYKEDKPSGSGLR
jgi:hypothetical protein